MEVPMLDEDEHKMASKLYRHGFETGKCNMTRLERFKDLLEYYKELTDYEETEPNAIMHHRIELYGPPCENCSKPYRTPKASFCAACGHKRLNFLTNTITGNTEQKWWHKILTVN
jgi:hypothetical protein